MIRTVVIAIAALGMTTGAYAGPCAKSSASGLGISKEIATFMSNKALKDMIAKNGEKGTGNVTTTCDSGAIVSTTCISSQRSCK